MAETLEMKAENIIDAGERVDAVLGK